MKRAGLALTIIALGIASLAWAGEHSGNAYIKEHGYQGPATCEVCHKGVAAEFLKTVHWTHASTAPHVEGTDPTKTYGMKNRHYAMCNGNEIVNALQEVRLGGTGQVKYSGCDSCHPGDGVHTSGSTGPGAEAAIDCLMCHSSAYDFSKRKAFKNEQGKVAIAQDRSIEAALGVGKPGVKNCMVCHESAGGGVLIKRGFAYTPELDAHAAKKMVCVDCHKVKNHRFPTGHDPNTWASDDELHITCADTSCHGSAPHKEAVLNSHFKRIACQSCHITKTGGTFAKDFVTWEQLPNGFYEPTTLRAEANQLQPVYAWYNLTVANTPRYIGPKGSKKDQKSKIYPFKLYEGKAYFDRTSGKLLVMDFGQPMANGDTLAGIRSAAKTLGLKNIDPVAGWQTLYFGANHLVSRKALSCEQCHRRTGVLNFKELGYTEKETRWLTSPERYFSYISRKQKEEWQ
jgi:hypothetical protein